MIYQLATLVDRIDGLPPLDMPGMPVPERAIAMRLRTLVQDASVDELKRRDTRGKRLTLEAFLQTLRNGVIDLADTISARYLQHSSPARLGGAT